MSADAIASGWVEKEVETAFEREQGTGGTVLIPIRLDATVMKRTTDWAADIKRTRHITDSTPWKEHDAYSRSLKRLLRDLKAAPFFFTRAGPPSASCATPWRSTSLADAD